MPKLSAKDFKAPLLVVLAEMSDWEPGVAIIFKDCYESVCKAMGIEDMKAHGTQESTGKLWIEQWIGWAFRALKTEGLGEAPRRGRWALTEQGLDLANTYKETGQVAAVEVPEIPESAVAAKVSKGSGVSIDFTDIETGDPNSTDADPYIQSLLIGKTKCLGKWSGRSSMCTNCPVQPACKSFMRSELAALADRMVKEEEKAKRKKGKPEDEVNMDDLLAEEESKGKGTAPNKTSLIKAALDSICETCGKKISRGEECYWDTGEGLYHKACVDG